MAEAVRAPGPAEAPVVQVSRLRAGAERASEALVPVLSVAAAAARRLAPHGLLVVQFRGSVVTATRAELGCLEARLRRHSRARQASPA